MDFKAFDTSKIEKYAKQATEKWGGTPEYEEFKQKDCSRMMEDQQALAGQMMQLFIEFAGMMEDEPHSPEAQAQVRKLQDFINDCYYQCSDEVLAGLGQMYGAGGDFTDNINAAAGDGVAEFASSAITAYCAR